MSHRSLNLGLIAGLFGSCALGCAHKVESPKLTLQSVGPDLLCNAQRLTPETALLLSGSGFAPMPSNVLAEPPILQLPTVNVTRSADLTGAASSGTAVAFSGKPDGAHAGELSWQSREQMSLRISDPDAASGTGMFLDAGLYDVQVTNPDGTTLQALPQSLAVIDPPKVSSLSIDDSSVKAPLAVCADQSNRRVSISGSSFLSLDGAAPQVALSGKAATTVATKNCQQVPGNFVAGQIELCDGLTLTLNKGEFAPGVHDVVVTSTAPADCASTEHQQLVVVPAPAVSSVTPAAICIDQNAQQMVVTGGSFARVGGTVNPIVTVTNATGTATTFQPDSLSNCAAPAGTPAGFGLELCDGLTFTLPTQAFPAGTYALHVTNPDPIGCTSTADIDFKIEPPPKVDSVAPGTVCAGGSVLVASGSDFVAGATAQLSCNNGTKLQSSLTSISGNGSQLSMTFGPGVTPGDTCTVTVQNPDGCQDRPLPHQTVVGTDGPVLFNADPSVAYNDINTKVNLFVTALQPPFTVTMWPSGSTNATPITLTAALAPGKTTQIQATVPAGTAPGDYDMAVNDGSGCAAIMTHAISVTNNLSINAGTVAPPFGLDASSQALTIVLGQASTATGVPRAFLNPPGDAPAVQLQSVTPINSTTLTAVAPAGTPAGSYDVVLVWPDGAVAVLSDAFTSVGARPVINDAVPQSLVNGSGQTLELRGTGFDASELSLRCKHAGTEVIIPGDSSAETCTSGCTQSATFDTTSLSSGDVCVARVTNADGVYAEFSAVGITNSSYNLSAPKPGPALNVGRRALASSAIQATSAARFVYAIGGDQGTVSSALSSVEFAPVDLFGNVSPWVQSRQPLADSAKRSFAADATLGRYVYVFGGNDGNGAIDTGFRALVLSPEEIPTVSNVDLCLGGNGADCFGAGATGAGLEPGNYSYRVAAVIDNADVQNLGGETLASDALILRLRGTQDRSILVKLQWTAPKDSLGANLTGITGYRIYRTPKDGTPGSDEQLIQEVGAGTTEFIDDGTLALAADQTPLPQGSTSNWQALPNLNSPREGARGVVAVDPADPTKWYVYSLLGRDGATGLDSYEYLPVTVLANGRQTIANSWTTGAQHSAVGRWQLGAWSIDSVDNHFISDATTTYIYMGGGLLADGTTRDGRVEAGVVAAGGEIGAFADVAGPSDTVKDFSSTRVGYGTAGAADRLFVFGGSAAGGVQSNAIAAGFIDPAPDMANNSWNNEGLTMTSPRYLMGSPIQSAFIFLIAGDNGTGVTTSTETVVW